MQNAVKLSMLHTSPFITSLLLQDLAATGEEKNEKGRNVRCYKEEKYSSKIVFAVMRAPSSSLAAKVEKLAGPVYPRSQENLNAKMQAW